MHDEQQQQQQQQPEYILNINPATGTEILPRIPCTTQVDRAVATAVAAQREWRATPLSDRIQLLRHGVEQLASESESLATTIVHEMGKPLREAQAEVAAAVKRDAYWDLLEEILAPSPRGPYCRVVRHPYGVCAVISPWNFPCDELLLLALPALASGNTVLVKPSEQTPLTGQRTVAALQSTLPLPGVVQCVQGYGTQSVGAALVDHPDVPLLALTGSTATGQRVRQQAAAHNNTKRVLLEMGGKDAMLVWGSDDDDDDSLLARAAKDAVHYSVANAGQVCCAVERVLVDARIYDTFVERVVQEAQHHVVGNGLDPNTTVGPLVSESQWDKVQAQVTDAIQKGARLMYQSAIPKDTNGFFYPVTVIADVTPEMDLYHQETFGPIVCLVTPFRDETEAIAMAHDTVFGLMASVYTNDPVQAQRVADQLEVGQVGINGSALDHMDVACPWVGHRQSGYGFHSGREGFLQCSIPKTIVTVPTSPPS